MSTKRVISLIASATEIVSALGFESSLVGRSHECDFPPDIKKLPVCTKPKFDIEGSSADIDERVKKLAENANVQTATESNPKVALSVYDVFGDVLEQLKPDVIVTQSHCDVCAVSLRDVEKAVSEFVRHKEGAIRPDESRRDFWRISSRPQIVSLEPNALEDIWRGIGQVADALSAPERGRGLVASLKNRISDISSQAKPSSKPSVAYLEWIDPLMAGGNWMPELVELAGGLNLFGEAGKHSPWMSWEELVQKNPDVIIIAPCGFDIQRSRADLPVLIQKPEWKNLSAVQKNRVFVADGNQFFNRPGPRVVESLEILAEIFHPDIFHFGHEGNGWEKL